MNGVSGVMSEFRGGDSSEHRRSVAPRITRYGLSQAVICGAVGYIRDDSFQGVVTQPQIAAASNGPLIIPSQVGAVGLFAETADTSLATSSIMPYLLQCFAESLLGTDQREAIDRISRDLPSSVRVVGMQIVSESRIKPIDTTFIGGKNEESGSFTSIFVSGLERKNIRQYRPEELEIFVNGKAPQNRIQPPSIVNAGIGQVHIALPVGFTDVGIKNLTALLGRQDLNKALDLRNEVGRREIATALLLEIATMVSRNGAELAVPLQSLYLMEVASLERTIPVQINELPGRVMNAAGKLFKGLMGHRSGQEVNEFGIRIGTNGSGAGIIP